MWDKTKGDFWIKWQIMGTSGEHPEIYFPEESFLGLCPTLQVARPWLAGTDRTGLGGELVYFLQHDTFFYMQYMKVCIKFSVHTDTKQTVDNCVGSHGNPKLLTLKVLEIKKYALPFEFNHLEEFLGLHQHQRILHLLQSKVILHILPVLGVAEENQRDSAIYGGHLEL